MPDFEEGTPRKPGKEWTDEEKNRVCGQVLTGPLGRKFRAWARRRCPRIHPDDVASTLGYACALAILYYDPQRGSFEGLVWRTATRELKDLSIKQSIRELSSLVIDPIAPPGEDPEEGLKLSRVIAHCVDSLRKAEHRAAFILHHLEDKPIRDIAVILAAPESTVKCWLRRARQEIWACLVQKGVI